MRIASPRAGSAAHHYVSTTPLPGFLWTSADELARKLITARFLRRERYLEMKHLDPAWMVGLYLRALALRVILRGH